MPHIQCLSSHVADLIAAGEVVERPASVVKELCENAVDAGAHTVTVELRHGGMTLIRVTDDGCGIAPEEAPTAFLRHATSKIRDEYDLEAISTLGFRGEALAAIAAVARVELLTRRQEDEMGTSLAIEGGELLGQEEAGCPLGTTFLVRDLFYNTPARLKFMKKDAAEGAACLAVLQRQALAHPEVSFKLLRDGKQELFTPGDGSLKSAMYAILGRDMALGFVPVESVGDNVSVSGFVSMPTCCRGTRGSQFFFVNGRYIKSQALTAALEQAYANQKMVGKFPGCVLHLTVKLNAVDVNVHPTKQEVKFGAEREVFSAVHYAVLSALGADHSRPAVQVETPRRPAAEPQGVQTVLPFPTQTKSETAEFGGVLHAPDSLWLGAKIPAGKIGGFQEPKEWAELRAMFRPPEPTAENPHPTVNLFRKPSEKSTAAKPSVEPKPPVAESPVETVTSERETVKITPAPSVSRDNLPEETEKIEQRLEPVPKIEPTERETTAERRSELSAEYVPALETEQEEPWRIAGELFHTYIIVEQGETVLLIDKHAAHERMNFDRMRAADYTPMSQTLLAPVIFTPAPEEGEVLLSHSEELERIGFEVSEFGGGALAVRSVPDYVELGETEAVLTQIAAKLALTGTTGEQERMDELYHTMACKAAIKGGWKSGREELEVVARAVMSGEVKYCPHGRPVAVELSRGYLEKQFKRRV